MELVTVILAIIIVIVLSLISVALAPGIHDLRRHTEGILETPGQLNEERIV